MQIGEFKQSELLLRDLESAFSSDPDFLSLYAATSRRLGDMTKAEMLFSKALELSPNSPNVLNNYANLLIDLKRFDEAEKILVTLISQHPDYKDARVNKNRLDQLRENYKSLDKPSPRSSIDLKHEADLGDPLC